MTLRTIHHGDPNPPQRMYVRFRSSVIQSSEETATLTKQCDPKRALFTAKHSGRRSIGQQPRFFSFWLATGSVVGLLKITVLSRTLTSSAA